MHPTTITTRAALICIALANTIACSTAHAQTWGVTRIFGQIDARQTNYNQVVPSRLFHPAGVLIDQMPSPAPSRLYIWDSGNNRILGFDHAGRCEAGPPQLQGTACTENSMCGPGGHCTGDLNAAAAIVIGQPSGYNEGACNGDNTKTAPARADSLCAIPYPYQISPLEGPRANQMAADAAHNLYVVDLQNNRLLRYTDPFTTDRVADALWGQADFTARECNRGRTAPDATTLCTGRTPGTYFLISGAVDVTADGKTIWVADYGNHRVLRFHPGNPAADLVLGQRTMLTANQNCNADRPLDAICRPDGIRYDKARDRLYVLEGDGDSGISRILVFDHPATNGQAANAVFAPPAGSSFFWPRGLTLDNVGNLWVSDTEHSRVIQYDPSGTLQRVLSKGDFQQTGCLGGLVGDNPAEYPQVCQPQGGIGIDRDGSVYVPDMQSQDVARYPAPLPLVRADGVAHSPDARMLSGYTWSNFIGATGLANPGYVLFINDQQMVVADRRRLLFWNDYLHGTNLAANGFLAQPTFNTQFNPTITHDQDFWALAHDARLRLMYATHGPFITAWSTRGGLTAGQAPAFQIASPIAMSGGGTTTFEASGIAIDPANPDVAWISDMRNSRVLRIVDVSKESRYVDLILGQPDAVIGQPDGPKGLCNRGGGNARVVQDGFCHPSEIKFDFSGNLFVVDGTWEGSRDSNARMLQFDKASLPPVPSSQLVWGSGGPLPARVYARTPSRRINARR
jgi:sugar lactone lactonase YvrE